LYHSPVRPMDSTLAPAFRVPITRVSLLGPYFTLAFDLMRSVSAIEAAVTSMRAVAMASVPFSVIVPP